MVPSIYARTVRDSCVTGLAMTGFLGFTVLMAGAAMSGWGTEGARSQMASFAASTPPAMQGMYGPPLQVDRFGGFVAWQYAGFFCLLAGLWSIVAMSSATASEAARGSLDMLLAAPLGRRRILAEKVAGQVTVLLAGMAVFAICLYLAAAIWGELPGDAISPLAASAFAAHVGVAGLAFGALALCLSVAFGRRAAIGIASAYMLGGYVAHGWGGAASVLEPLAWLSPFHWIANDVPLAGAPDPLPVLALAGLAAVLLLIACETFARLDVTVRSLALPRLGLLPGLPVGLGGPVARAFADHLPASLGFGLGLAVYGLVMAAASSSFAASMTHSPGMAAMFNDVFPGSDIRTGAGALQIAYIAFAFVAAGFASAVFVAGWASEETTGRLEMVLATPRSRAGVALRSGLGALAAVALVAGLASAGVLIGCLASGADASMALGVPALALYSAALLGVGFAIGGVARGSFAGPAVAVLAIGTFFVSLLGAALRLPDAVRQLALTSHLDQTMTGTWEAAGVAATLVLAVGGLCLGAWGIRRRDLSR